MRFLQVTFALLISGLTLWTEFDPVKESTIFTFEGNSFTFWILCTLTVIFAIINIRQFFSSKKVISFLPLLLCVTSISCVIWHQKKIEKLDNSLTKFTAYTYDIGNDGGLILDFKVNGHLKAEKRDHWTVTYYWGEYSQSHDTLNLSIPFNFKISRQALLTKDSLYFINDSTKFFVYRQ